MFLPYIPPISAVKPNRLEMPEKQKGKEYHSQYGRYILSNINSPVHRNFLVKTMVNWSFYQNNQWIFEEDLEPFLKDESGDVRNRIRMVYNIIQPMIQQYVGNAIRMDFQAKVMSCSEMVINRRESELARLKFFSRMAKNNPELKSVIKQNVPIGDDEQETEHIFENTWVDHYEKNMNRLVKFVSEVDNDFVKNKISIAEHIALSGLGIHKGYEYTGKQIWDVVDPQCFIFDYGARRKDLKDSEYMGEYSYKLPTEIFERWQNIESEERERLEKYASGYSNYSNAFYDQVFGNATNRPPVFELYWKDMQVQEYGYVIDEFGYEFLARINDDGKKSKYTDKDLIIPENENYVKFLGEGKKKRKMYVDVLRFVVFSPAAIIGGDEDIVLDYGMVPYQETYCLDPSNVEFPYKCCAWDYHGGKILSPIDAVIDPQRLTNRMISIGESHLNNARGTGTVIDKSAIDAQEGEEGILRNMNQSKPIIVDTRGKGVTNTVGSYGSNLDSRTDMIFNIGERMRVMAQNITGVNEMMTGTSGGGMKLKAVAQIQMDQGTLMQENFYYTLSDIFLQSFQGIAGQGKRIYCESKRRLSIIMGDEGAEEILLSKDYNLEDFRSYIRRVSPDMNDKQLANNMLIQLKAVGLLEEAEVANYFNRCTMDDMGRIMRESYKRRQMARMAMGKDQQEKAGMSVMQQQLMKEEMQHNQERMIQLGLSEEEKNRLLELEKTSLKSKNNLDKILLKHQLEK